MNKVVKSLLIVALCATTPVSLKAFFGKSYFGGRSQATDAARELVGWQDLINIDNDGCPYGAFYIMPICNRSFKHERISEYLFGLSPQLIFSGSRVEDRGANDILADYFGMPMDYQGSLCFEPHINNFILDLGFYCGLDCVAPGLYFRLHAPMTFTNWDLHMVECVGTTTSTTFYPAGYMATTNLTRDQMSDNLSLYLCGMDTFGDMSDPLKYGKICGRLVASKLAELTAALGWNATGQDYHAGVNARVAAPTGTRPESVFFFEPIIGNGAHWAVGVGLTGHYDLWQSCDGLSGWSVYADANFMHLFGAHQKRSYDLINGPGSRYMLLEYMASPANNLFVDGPGVNAQPNQYRGCLLPAINVTTLDTKISIAIEADIALKFAYRYKGLSFDIGYEYWARSAEKMDCRRKLPSNLYAIKGDAQIYGFDPLASFAAVPLNATQHNATLHAGQGAGNSDFRNLNADSPTTAFSANGALNQLLAANAAALGIAVATVQTSNPAILLQDSDIDNNSVLMPKAMSNKFFFNLGNTWYDQEVFTPFFGIGGDIEWADGCVQKNSAYTQWSVWAKAGLSY